jgi:hypothetical protein
MCDGVRVPMARHRGRTGGKKENEKRRRRRRDGPGQKVIKVEASGVEGGLETRQVGCGTRSRAVIESRAQHEAVHFASSCGRYYVRIVFRTSCEGDYLSFEPQASSAWLEVLEGVR